MAALNFKSQFAPAVESGAKLQTIRAKRKHPIKVGDTLHLFTGMRQKGCRKLRTATCKRVRDITIGTTDFCLWVSLEGRGLGATERLELANSDGFGSLDEFREFFRATHGDSFIGQLIEWQNTEVSNDPQR